MFLILGKHIIGILHPTAAPVAVGLRIGLQGWRFGRRIVVYNA
jgi:hypothetical protein